MVTNFAAAAAGAKEFVPWDQVPTRVPQLLDQIQVRQAAGWLLPARHDTHMSALVLPQDGQGNCVGFAV